MMRQREDYTHPCRERTHRARPLASAFAVPAASFLRGCRRQKESKGAFSFCHHQQRMFFYFIFSLCAWGRAGPSFLTAEREQDHIFSPPAEGQLFVFYTYLFLFALRPRGPILSGGRKDAKTAEGGRPLRKPPWAYLFFGKAGSYLFLATSYGRSGGRLFPSPHQILSPRSAPRSRCQKSEVRFQNFSPKQTHTFGFVLSFGGALTPHTASSGKATFLFCCLLRPPKPKGTLTTCKNPTAGCDKCRKVSKGALPLWSVRRGFQRGTHRKGSPWCSLLPF